MKSEFDQIHKFVKNWLLDHKLMKKSEFNPNLSFKYLYNLLIEHVSTTYSVSGYSDPGIFPYLSRIKDAIGETNEYYDITHNTQYFNLMTKISNYL